MAQTGVLTAAVRYTTFANAKVLIIRILPFKERSLLFHQCNSFFFFIDSTVSDQFFLSASSFRYAQYTPRALTIDLYQFIPSKEFHLFSCLPNQNPSIISLCSLRPDTLQKSSTVFKHVLIASSSFKKIVVSSANCEIWILLIWSLIFNSKPFFLYFYV